MEELRIRPSVSNSRRTAVAVAERVRRRFPNGPPPPAFTPQRFEDMDPAILAYIPQRIRTGSGPTTELLGPFPTLSAVIAATTGYRAQGGAGGTKDLGKSTQNLLVDSLKLEDIHISNSTHPSTSTN